jgi:hypothetical protein
MKFLRAIRGPRPAKKVFRRYETEPGAEAQVDWSPYRVPIGGCDTRVHAFSMVLGFSRMLFVRFYRDERLPSLLDGHVSAFTAFAGVCRRILYDNMTTVTLGRIRGEPHWHPLFLEFARHHGFTPRACRFRDPNRKGKVERPFFYLETDFLKAAAFASWDELNARVRRWLDEVSNRRMHSTIREVPVERFEREKQALIALPSTPFPTERTEVRKVAVDGTVQLDGSIYPVGEARLVGQYVRLRVYPDRVEVVDGAGRTVAAHRVPDRPMRLPVPEAMTRAPDPPARSVLEARFAARFSGHEAFLEGLQRRMKSLAWVHLRRLEALADLYGDAAAGAALARAEEYGNFNATAVERILERAHPDVIADPPGAAPQVPPQTLGALDDVETGSPAEYPYDSMEAKGGIADGT